MRLKIELDQLDKIMKIDQKFNNKQKYGLVPIGNTSDLNFDKLREDAKPAKKVGDEEWESAIKEVQFPDEMNDWRKVLTEAALSGHHSPNNWLKSDGRKCSRKDMYASIFRHVAEAYCGNTRDKDSGLHPILHACARMMMVYTRWNKNLVHPDDLGDNHG